MTFLCKQRKLEQWLATYNHDKVYKSGISLLTACTNSILRVH